VLAGVGIALLPAPYVRRLDAARFTCLPVTDPQVPWDMAIGWKRSSYLSHAARAWLDVAREESGKPSTFLDDFVRPPGLEKPAAQA
jgi:DNA-binding transcriptional LysR family regulator